VRRKLSKKEMRILQALDAPNAPLFGYEVGQAAKIWPGTLYPILYKLERDGFVAGEWETDEPQPDQKGRRRYYHLTLAGIRAVQRVSVQT
jgi:DNA-binding PadR family transcriptional regulator